MYTLFGSGFTEGIREAAFKSSRKRAHYNIHRSYDEPVQQVTICLSKGTYIPPHFHRHRHQRELFVLLSGSVRFILFDDTGCVQDTIMLESGEMIEIKPLTIHTVVALSDYALVLEVKQGPFVVDESKEFMEWTIPEGDPSSDRYVSWLETAVLGESYCGFETAKGKRLG